MIVVLLFPPCSCTFSIGIVIGFGKVKAKLGTSGSFYLGITFLAIRTNRLMTIGAHGPARRVRFLIALL